MSELPPETSAAGTRTREPGNAAAAGRTRAALPARAPMASLPSLLEQAVALLADDAQSLAPQRVRLAGLRERWVAGRFHLAVLGQFKRGKSTLLNALVGEPVLPVSVVPLTAVPTYLRFGDSTTATVHFAGGGEGTGTGTGTETGTETGTGESEGEGTARPPERCVAPPAELAGFLARFVAEEGNPGNRLGVARAEVELPAPLLREGVVLIDTPGIGSTLRHNTEATLNFLPQCDAALFLVSADPPITAAEIEFLAAVRAQVPRLFFVLNKIDYLEDGERETAVEFLRATLVERAGVERDAPIDCVSARRGLAARTDAGETGDRGGGERAGGGAGGHPDAWIASGMAGVEERLLRFVREEKAATLHVALAAKARDVLDDALMQTRLAVRSLEMPLDDLRAKMETFERCIDEARRERLHGDDLLAGDRKRLLERLEEEAAALRRAARRFLEARLVEAGAGVAPHALQRATRAMLAEAVPGFFEHQFGECTRRFGELLGGVMDEHQQRADALATAVRRDAAALFDIPFRAAAGGGGLRVRRQPYWVTHRWDTVLGLLPPGVADRLLPAGLARRLALRRLRAGIERLVVGNVENLRWSVLQAIQDSLAGFASSLDAQLEETITVTQGALQAAAATREREAGAVSDALERLGARAAALAELRAALAGLAGERQATAAVVE